VLISPQHPLFEVSFSSCSPTVAFERTYTSASLLHRMALQRLLLSEALLKVSAWQTPSACVSSMVFNRLLHNSFEVDVEVRT
jgi:hypothetical protein